MLELVSSKMGNFLDLDFMRMSKMMAGISRLIMMLLFVTSQAVWGTPNYTCLVDVTSVDIRADGTVQASLTGDMENTIGNSVKICNLENKHGVYTSKSCQATYSLLLAASASQKKVTVFFEDDSNLPLYENRSCNKGNWEDLQYAGIYYIRYNAY